MVLSGVIQRINHVLLNIPGFICRRAVAHYAMREVNFGSVGFFFLMRAFFSDLQEEGSQRRCEKHSLAPLALRSYLSLRNTALFTTLFLLMCKRDITWPLLSLSPSRHFPAPLPRLCRSHRRHLAPSSSTCCPRACTCPWPGEVATQNPSHVRNVSLSRPKSLAQHLCMATAHH